MAASFANFHVLFLIWFLSATFSLSFYFFKAESISNVSCNQKDKQALLTLKRGLTDHGHVLSSWSDHKDCCIWDRVFCDNKTGRVSELHLSYSRLGGEISGSLLQLEHLNYLDLSGNDFNCTPIPAFLGSMYSLTDLDLSNANFCGLIPHQLGNLSSLHYLFLWNNSNIYVDNLRWMSGLSAIQYLDLSSADLHREVDWLQIMSKFPSLSELYLQNCQLDSLNPSLGFVNFTSLRVLFLSENHFSHEIPNWFSNLSTSLLELELYNSSLKGNIPPSIFNLEKLEYLNLGFNKLTEQIPEPLGQLKLLTYLDLGFNSLNGPIPSSVGNLSRIRSLYLDQNQLNGTIPKSLGFLSKLETFFVGDNSFTSTVDEGHFTKLSKLKSLYMSKASLIFNVNSNWVPPFQLNYASMSSIKIGPNFPSWLQSQRSLSFLDMSMSGISGKAPGWFWNGTSNITFINLSNNHIECDVSNIFLSSSVKVLNIANNSFYGPISTFLCQKKIRKNKLEILDVSNNLLSGELSHCWKYWQSLIHLNLGSNNLVGRIPYSMGALVNLQSLRLQNNSICGDIPSSLKKCSNLRLIDMGNNHLSIIPLWIGEMTNLLVLRLRMSEFKGYIPQQICQLSSLRVLDLANNSLSGSIPNCLKNISAMAFPNSYDISFFSMSFSYSYAYEYYVANVQLVPKGKEMEYKENLNLVRLIDLSSNNLSGSIPVEISDLSELRFLNLSRNHLMGKIPEKIGSMKELESVDLSRNHLSGKIPPSMSNLTFLSLLDLSYNNLSGRIPSSTQLQSFDALRYIGNPQLCGDPLPKNCTIEEQFLNRSPIGSVEDDSKNSSFYIGMGVGFATGFWAICGALFFNRTWRHAYFRFADEIKDWIYVTTMIKMNLLEKLRVCLSK
ncbi:receptor-like protein EIX2 [Quercus suber]|uniref:receptor-like protein EIX2 n=1 Tax=Quercus suber TaxID=58331 RepID=UPI000CE184BB|nr:receptor-like protein EIX2 [Quercus suber]XP_023892044.1 receptor-like protein EIX2 [Quercus suber]XP_023892045.1 receptor-like protein EIX2 [Quercus suber]XP_023892046.1 receptor-like protein EIX2 [Quercus suber]XP_023892047.1 receptor-like protein EIX2 [Quercus suber]XP_023892048.1 receptor-like protein EIX2 [Quercus suber]XP_023892049.1 receptor-like protein EIX2 [Quercus suber]